MNHHDFNTPRPGDPQPLDAHWHPDGLGPQVLPLHAAVTPLTDIQVQLELSWAAGFLDGEGCITLAQTRRDCGYRLHYRARVYIPQNCEQTLDRFRDIVGERCTKVRLPDRASYSRPVYQLGYDGVHALRLLQKLRPYLVRKAAEADVIFEFYRHGEVSRHFGPKGVPADVWRFRQRCHEALRCLK